MLSNIAIILVSPQMGENIGASARIMQNFGLNDLRIISPRDGWPNIKAESVAAGGIDIIKKAKIFASLNEAIIDLSYIYATTATPRSMNKNYVLSSKLTDDIVGQANIGIMFGRESSGLSNEEIAQANKILVIDTDDKYSSLNISHAVSIICYELFSAKKVLRSDLKNAQDLASIDDLNYFYEKLFVKLDERNFFKLPDKKNKMSQKIKNLFSRIENLSTQEVQILHGIVTSLTNNKK